MNIKWIKSPLSIFSFRLIQINEVIVVGRGTNQPVGMKSRWII